MAGISGKIDDELEIFVGVVRYITLIGFIRFIAYI